MKGILLTLACVSLIILAPACKPKKKAPTKKPVKKERVKKVLPATPMKMKK